MKEDRVRPSADETVVADLLEDDDDTGWCFELVPGVEISMLVGVIAFDSGVLDLSYWTYNQQPYCGTRPINNKSISQSATFYSGSSNQDPMTYTHTAEGPSKQ